MKKNQFRFVLTATVPNHSQELKVSAMTRGGAIELFAQKVRTTDSLNDFTVKIEERA